MAKKKHSPDSEEIIKNKWLVKFDRGRFDSEIGFVLDVNEEFTLINNFDFESTSTTGFSIFKNKSVKDYELYDDPNSFDALLVDLKKVKPKKKPFISINTINDLLKTVNENFPLIVIHREKVDKEICQIGKIVEIKKNAFLMLEIDTNAEWYKKPSKY